LHRSIFGNASHRIASGRSDSRRLVGIRAGFAQRGRARKRRTKRKGPAAKGSGPGPEMPRIGRIHYEGTRSGRKAGDVNRLLFTTMARAREFPKFAVAAFRLVRRTA